MYVNVYGWGRKGEDIRISDLHTVARKTVTSSSARTLTGWRRDHRRAARRQIEMKRRAPPTPRRTGAWFVSFDCERKKFGSKLGSKSGRKLPFALEKGFMGWPKPAPVLGGGGMDWKESISSLVLSFSFSFFSSRVNARLDSSI